MNKENVKNLIADYTIRLTPDPECGYTASILELPGCLAEGDTADEAIKNLHIAADAWMNAAASNGYLIRPPIDFEGYTGKIPLQLPRSLHRRAIEIAELEGCDLNTLLIAAIAQYVGSKHI